MPKPIKLRDLLAALRKLDPDIECSTQRGKGSHLVLSKNYGKETRSFPLPTSSGEVLGPYQSKIISLFGLPQDAFHPSRKKKDS